MIVKPGVSPFSHSALRNTLFLLCPLAVGMLGIQQCGNSNDTDDDGDEWTELDGDCDDTNGSIYPGADELCDGIDNNCDTLIDEGFEQVISYVDADADGYGDDSTVTSSCSLPEGNVTVGGDCDDSSADINPLALEVCDGLDGNCDGTAEAIDTCASTDWMYARPLTIDSTTAVSGYAISVVIDTGTLIAEGKLRSGCEDLRVADDSGFFLPYWIERQPSGFACGGSSTRVWIKTDLSPDASVSLSLLYGNSSAEDQQSGAEVFTVFEDFSSQDSFDATWRKVSNGGAAAFVVSEGTLEIQGGGTPNLALAPDPGFSDYSLEVDMYYPGSGTGQFAGNAGGILGRYTDTGNYYHQELDQNNLNLYRFSGFSYTFQSGTASTNKYNTWYRESYRLVGSSISSNTQPQGVSASTTDTLYPSGLAGLYRWDANVRFDNFRLHPAIASEPRVTLGEETVR